MVNIDVNDFISINFDILRPANEVCEGYVFTGVCLSRGVSASGPGRGSLPHPLGRHTPWADIPRADTPLDRHPHLGRHHPGQTPSPWVDAPSGQCMLGYTPTSQCMYGYPPPPHCPVHARIRATSGQYASHWNAFLLTLQLNSTTGLH